MTEYIFVYGSLRKDLINHEIMIRIGAKFIDNFQTVDAYYMIGLKSKAYPYVIKENIGYNLIPGPIYGEVYEISEEGLYHLDKLEGHPTNYIRQQIRVCNDKYEMNAFIYIVENEEMIKEIKNNFNKRFISVHGNNWKNFILNLNS
jgi:gamma-glutamylcyclotransferase (GGCT)/AIG2-like uncharacterized protein YtfP